MKRERIDRNDKWMLWRLSNASFCPLLLSEWSIRFFFLSTLLPLRYSWMCFLCLAQYTLLSRSAWSARGRGERRNELALFFIPNLSPSPLISPFPFSISFLPYASALFATFSLVHPTALSVKMEEKRREEQGADPCFPYFPSPFSFCVSNKLSGLLRQFGIISSAVSQPSHFFFKCVSLSSLFTFPMFLAQSTSSSNLL